MEKTKNLNLWLPGSGDPVEIAKLSENFQALDTTIRKIGWLSASLASALGLSGDPTVIDALTKLRSLVTTAQSTADSKTRMAHGDYTGDSQATKTITCGFSPKVVILTGINRDFGNYIAVAVYGGLFCGLSATDTLAKGLQNATISYNSTGITISGNDVGYYYNSTGRKNSWAAWG